LRAATATRVLSLAVLAAILIQACTEKAGPRITGLTEAARRANEGTDLPTIEVCKEGGPAGTYKFHASQVGGGESDASVPNDVTLVYDGILRACSPIWAGANVASWTGVTATVDVSEVDIPSGIHTAMIEVHQFNPPNVIKYPDVSTAPVTVNLGSISRAKFENQKDNICTDDRAMNFGGPLPCVLPPLTTPCPAGSFLYTFAANGDLIIRYDQFPAPNDNSYGVNSIGWKKGHKFTDLVNSDHAGFQLIDGGGVVRLSFNVDYLSANASAPSGYASLGVSGGDGGMLVGTAAGITATTSLDRNLNGVNIPGLFNAAHVQQFGSVNVLVNSPPTDANHVTYVNSDPTLAGWDFHDTYFVTVSAAKLASIGFSAATWRVEPNASQLHNSPPKACPATTVSGVLGALKFEAKDKQIKVTIQNNGLTPVYLEGLTLTWPDAINGKLTQIKLDADVVWNGPAATGPSIGLALAQLVADQNKRKIDHGTSDKYTLVFEKNVDLDLSHYMASVTFSGTTLVFLPQ